MSKLQDMIDQGKALKERMKSEGQDAVKEMFFDFFQKHPEVRAIVWAQYAPWFNDGDACEFSVNDLELRLDLDKVAEDVRKVLGYLSNDDDSDSESHESALKNIDEDESYQNHYIKKAGLQKRRLTPEERSILDDFAKLNKTCQEAEDVMELAFGNHVQVCATREGFKISTYEHDLAMSSYTPGDVRDHRSILQDLISKAERRGHVFYAACEEISMTFLTCTRCGMAGCVYFHNNDFDGRLFENGCKGR